MIHQSIRDKFGKPGQFRIDGPDAFIRIHHLLMKEYGWIPLEEYSNLPLPTIWMMLDCIQQDKEAEKKQMEHSKRGRR